MSSEISKFIKNVPVGSLKNYFDSVHSDLAKDVDWDSDDESIRKSLLTLSEGIPIEKVALLGSDTERINSLTDELGQTILKHFVRDEELKEYYQLENEYERVLWLFLKDTERFVQVEDSWYTDTRRQGRMWDAFVGPEDLDISADVDDLSSFKNKVMDLFRAVGNIKVDVYKRNRPDGEDNEVEIIQIMVYREDLPNTQLTFDENKKLTSKIVRPVKEVALTYEPKNGHIEIIAEGTEHRRAIARIFSETLLKSLIEGDKIPLKQYDIQSLLKPRTLSFDSEDGIESVKVTMLKISPPNSNNNVTLDVATKEERSIYDLSKEYFGDNDPLKSGFRLRQVRISIKFMPDHESRRGKVMHVKIREPNGCDLKSKSQKEKLIGDKYLDQWELVKAIQ